MSRKLASIQIINNIESISGRDRVDKATVLGWTVIIKKGEFTEREKIIYIEYDSILPDGPSWCEFMRSRKFRIRTMKVNCKEEIVISQGLVFPCSILPGSYDFPIDTEVTEQLGIKKYEPLLHDGGINMGRAEGAFPSHIPKTDEIRLQSSPELINELKEAGPFYISTKIDGTSSTFCYVEDKFNVCSRNWNKKEDELNVYWMMAKKYKLDEVLKDKQIAIQGEIAGPKLLANRLRLLEPDLFVFDIFDIKSGKYFSFYDMIKFCKDNDLRTVPIDLVVENGFDTFDYSFQAWLKRAEGLYENTDQQREGIVVRPLTHKYSKELKGRMSFKVINNLYLFSGGT